MGPSKVELIRCPQVHKPGLTEDKVDGLLASGAQRSGWALCIGAGTSLPIFPDWNRLVRQLFERTSPGDAAHIADELGANFSADALIQAAATRHEGDSESFARLITEELYRDFFASFTAEEAKIVVRALSATRPSDLSPSAWARFLELLQARWGESMSCLAIAALVSKSLGTSRSPSAILSFNAEPLLFATLNAHQACAERDDRGDVPPQRVDRVVRGISNRSVGRIPYIFCHGLLPIPGADATRHVPPPGQLVFSESAYLHLADKAYAWQASSFLEACTARRVVFVGLSLSDANMRRWLYRVHSGRITEFEQIGRMDVVSTQHFWLDLDPGDAELRAWIEASVAHLGVRLVWLTSWDAIGPVLARMLG